MPHSCRNTTKNQEDNNMDPKQTDVNTNERWRMLIFLSIALVLAQSIWFSASAVVPQLRSAWALTPSSAAWLTIAVQIGFVCGALVSVAIHKTVVKNTIVVRVPK